MKQPELGKRILELRKAKGFTQEELVDKCNINVRTIQRIEAGEVSPRNFTIRTILEVLGVESDSFFGVSEPTNSEVSYSTKDVNALRLSWIAGIFFTVFAGVSMFLEFTVLFDYQYSYDEIMIRGLLGALMLVSLFYFLRGYKTLGDRLHKTSLVYGSYIYFAVELISIFIMLILTIYNFDSSVTELTSGVLLAVLLGAAELILGIAIMKLKDVFGSFASTIGIAKIVYGAMLLTVLLSVFAIFMAIPLLIAETVFLYQITKKISE